MTEEVTILKEKHRVRLDDATIEQVRQFCESEMGLAVKNTTPVHILKKQLAAAGWDQDFITTDIGEGGQITTARAKPAVAPAPGQATEPMVEITIANQDAPGGKQPVFVAVNGKGILVPRNKRCAIKLRYVSALEIALQTTYELTTDEITGRETITSSDSPVHPFQVHRSPNEDTVAAWKAYERSQPEWHNSLDPKVAKAA